MDDFTIFSTAVTTAFLQVPHLYTTNRLWKRIDTPFLIEFLQKNANANSKEIISRKAICHIDPSWVNLNASFIKDDTISIRATTSNMELDVTSRISLALPIHGDDTMAELDKMKRTLSDLSEKFNLELIITEEPAYFEPELTSKDDGVWIYLHALGLQSNLMECEPQLLAFVDLLKKNGMTLPPQHYIVEPMELNSYSALPLYMGADMANFKYISRVFKTSIYAPSLMTLSKNYRANPQIFFSGTVNSLALLAKKTLHESIDLDSKSFFYRRLTNITPGKLLFIRKYYQQKMNQLILKYQSLIRVTDEYIEFQSISTNVLEMVIKNFTIQVLHEIVEVQISLNENCEMSSKLIIDNLLSSTENQVVVVTPGKDSFSQLIIVGNQSSTNEAYDTSILHCLSNFITAPNQIINPNLRQIKAIFEIHPDFEDFISGKKNGKLTRIMELSACLVQLEMEEEDDNLYLNLISDSFSDFEKSFKNVMNEFPAEESFFIPEVCHRPIIGTGGSLIQATMRKHNVFIQFSNSFSLPQNKISIIRYDNVIIRCPRKNKANIRLAKRDLKEIVQGYENMQSKVLIKLSKGQYRHILNVNGEKNIIGQIEKNENVHIVMPLEEPLEGTSQLSVKGNDENTSRAANELVNSAFSYEYELRTDKPIDARKEYEFYNLIAVPFLQTMNIIVTFEKDLITFTFAKDTSESILVKAIELLSDYMGTQKRKVIFKKLIKQFILPSTTNKNNGSNNTTSGSFKSIHSNKSRTANDNSNSSGSLPQRQSNNPNYKIPVAAPTGGVRAIKGYIPNNYYNGFGYGYGYNYEYDYNYTNSNQVQTNYRHKYQNGRK
ncbi:YLL032C [Saccharomyces arboricola H-6]|uniref:YLL032C n=1 Tax=Saccharomyces arboricola (strain H-6 / AS 2.3317 / CBS 10644) TaxID=1160507 RepID=J8Q2C8_SACAR|nr:YLL032C [Saccharomyces arboricola H-6]